MRDATTEDHMETWRYTGVCTCVRVSVRVSPWRTWNRWRAAVTQVAVLRDSEAECWGNRCHSTCSTEITVHGASLFVQGASVYRVHNKQQHRVYMCQRSLSTVFNTQKQRATSWCSVGFKSLQFSVRKFNNNNTISLPVVKPAQQSMILYGWTINQIYLIYYWLSLVQKPPTMKDVTVSVCHVLWNNVSTRNLMCCTLKLKAVAVRSLRSTTNTDVQ